MATCDVITSFGVHQLAKQRRLARFISVRNSGYTRSEIFASGYAVIAFSLLQRHLIWCSLANCASDGSPLLEYYQIVGVSD